MTTDTVLEFRQDKHFRLDFEKQEFHLLDYTDNPEDWKFTIENLLMIARASNTFPSLQAKRDEHLPILGAQHPVSIERSASSLFGIIGRGVHMTAYTISRADGAMRFWIAKRNVKKHAYPGLLDNVVAGGISVGETPWSCICKEAEEEAGILEKDMEKWAKPAGMISWFNISDERAGGVKGLLNPGASLVYDIKVSERMIFEPVDGDVDSFYLMAVKEVMTAMKCGLFKPLSACVMLDFFIRHGIVTAENEPDYLEIVSRLHRRLPFPMK
jgi:8-oxo-dGTP pyrophosphatase MutT (NUDIX family)